MIPLVLLINVQVTSETDPVRKYLEYNSWSLVGIGTNITTDTNNECKRNYSFEIEELKLSA